jgi:hypothetical protein
LELVIVGLAPPGFASSGKAFCFKIRNGGTHDEQAGRIVSDPAVLEIGQARLAVIHDQFHAVPEGQGVAGIQDGKQSVRFHSLPISLWAILYIFQRGLIFFHEICSEA